VDFRPEEFGKAERKTEHQRLQSAQPVRLDGPEAHYVEGTGSDAKGAKGKVKWA
jgi:hypothetical protein